ncbi:MAG: tetratricopeptide repeat protein [Flavobacteriales bacterium]|nr:MAG: tetratricopeptide repeat protein [Flavobacteriales bacterium]
MKKLAILMMLMICSNSFTQKKELRQINKLISESFFNEAQSSLEAISSLVEVSDDKIKAQYYFYLAKVSNELEKFNDAIKAYENLKSINDSAYSTIIKTEFDFLYSQIETSIINSAVEDNRNSNYSVASDKLIMAYRMNEEKNRDYLYFAAGSAVNSKEYDKALNYYVELKENNYTGVIDEYYITNNETGEEEKVSETEFDLLKNSKDYSNPIVGQTESRYPEIVKNIALIYVQQGKNDVAIEAIQEARSIQPDDTSLILNEADLYIRISNNSDDESERDLYRKKFKELMELAITKDPENGILYYNLGVISSEQGENDSALEYYKKAIEFKPDYVDAYLNLVAVILDGEQSIVDEMNNLGTSKKDNIRYDELIVERENLYKECIPFLEKLIEVSPTNIDALNTLKNIYGVLGENEKFKDISAKINEIKG